MNVSCDRIWEGGKGEWEISAGGKKYETTVGDEIERN